MRYRIRRMFHAGVTVGAFIEVGGRVSTLMVREYFFETPRINPWPFVATLADASVEAVAMEVLTKHPGLEIGPVQLTPEVGDLLSRSGTLQERYRRWLEIRAWLRGKKPYRRFLEG